MNKKLNNDIIIFIFYFNLLLFDLIQCVLLIDVLFFFKSIAYIK